MTATRYKKTEYVLYAMPMISCTAAEIGNILMDYNGFNKIFRLSCKIAVCVASADMVAKLRLLVSHISRQFWLDLYLK